MIYLTVGVLVLEFLHASGFHNGLDKSQSLLVVITDSVEPFEDFPGVLWKYVVVYDGHVLFMLWH